MAHTAERLSKAVATARATAARCRKTDAGAEVKTRVFHGITLAIDRPKGFVQTGTDEDGTAWERTYLYDYGEIPGTQGGDGDGLDVFVGDNEAAPNAFWILQTKADGSFDEYKVMLGFPDGGTAREAYCKHVPEQYLGGMAMTSVEMIKALIGVAPAEVTKALAIDAIARVLDAEEKRVAPNKADEHVLTVTTSGEAHHALVKVAKVLQRAGQVGAGTEVLYETGGGLFKCCGFDGDGQSAIGRIELDGEEMKSAEADFEADDQRIASSANAYTKAKKPHDVEPREEAKAVPERYQDIDFAPPQGVRDRLTRGLELHEQGHSGDGLQADTVAWATRMAGGDPVSPEKARQMVAWFARHDVDRKPAWDNPPTPGYVAWLLWGGDDGRAWAGKLVEQMDARDHEAQQKSAPRDRTADVVAVGKAAPGNDNAEERYVLGIVLKPEEVDLQGDIYSADEIRKTAHLYLAEYRNIDRQHKELINPLVRVVESYIAPVDMQIGEKTVAAGTWLLGVRVVDDTLWQQIKNKTLTGFSIRGWSKKTMLAAA